MGTTSKLDKKAKELADTYEFMDICPKRQPMKQEAPQANIGSGEG